MAVARASTLNKSTTVLDSKVDTGLTRKVSTGDLLPVGSIVYSALTEVQFQALNGVNWVLADARNVSGSAYHTLTGSATVPDGRGVLLRGKNNGRSDGNQDTAGERALAAYQASALPNITGRCDMTYGAMRPVYGGAIVSEDIGPNSSTTPGYGGSIEAGYFDIIASRQNPTIYQAATEARVKNVCLNCFIKIGY